MDLECFKTIEYVLCLTEDVPSNRWFSLLICVADHDPVAISDAGSLLRRGDKCWYIYLGKL